jgi:hypothetical protein
MPRFFTQSLTLLFISVILLPGLALGDTVIDDFTFPNPKFDVTSDTPGTTPGTDSGPTSSIIGGTRDRTTTVTSPAGDGDINNQNRSPGGAGLYEFSSTPGGDGSSVAVQFFNLKLVQTQRREFDISRGWAQKLRQARVTATR